MQFRANIKVHGKPKRSVQSLCSFNRAVADRIKYSKKENKFKLNEFVIFKKKRKVDSIASNFCPICGKPAQNNEDMTFTDSPVCNQFMYNAIEPNTCPDCGT